MNNISKWLEALDLGQYTGLFAEHSIDVDVLSELTEQDLESLQIALGDRKRLLRAIRDKAVAHHADANEPSAIVDANVKAERRQLTVMFCDLVGSTQLSVRFDPEDLQSIMSQYQSCCAQVVANYGGTVARYMGDGVLVYFGFPQADELDAERALRAALEIVDAVGKLRSHGDVVLETRVGIDTGEVVVGRVVGDGASRENTVVGSVPNLAARLQAMAVPDSVVISRATRRLADNVFEYADLGTHTLKGFEEPVQAWRVAGLRSIESRFEATRAGSYRIPLVGRERELKVLRDRWIWACGGRGQLVLIEGEAGIGKSRLIQAFRQHVATDQHHLLRFFCAPYNQNSAMFPIISGVERGANTSSDGTSGTRLDNLRSFLGPRIADNVDAIALLASLLSIPPEEGYTPPDLTPQRQKERTLDALVDYIAGAADEKPVLIILEDAHWSDPTTLELLDELRIRLPALRILVLVTCRPEKPPQWDDQSHTFRVTLGRLGAAQAEALVAQLSGDKPFSHEVVRHIAKKGDGIPLFIEELAKTVLESGAVEERGGQYVPSGDALELSVPSTLRDSLMARLDRLAPARDVAQLAAAIGREFSYEMLAAILGDDTRLRNALEQLIRAQLIFTRGEPPNANYMFKHALVQDVAYSTLLRPERQQLHEQIANTFEQRFPEAGHTRPELLAHHWLRAGNKVGAVSYLQRAGEVAAQRGAFAEAGKHVNEALGVLAGLPDEPTRDGLELGLQLLLGLSAGSTLGYAAPDVENAYDRAQAICVRLGNTPDLFPIIRNLFQFHLVRDELLRARELADECMRLGKESANPAFLIEAYTAMGYAQCYMGELTDAQVSLQMSLSLYERHREERLQFVTQQDPGVGCYALLAMVECLLGYPDRALETKRRGLALADDLEQPFSTVFAHAFAATLHQIRREPEMVAFHARATINISAEHGFEIWLLSGQLHASFAQAALDDPYEGINGLEIALSGWRGGGAECFVPYMLFELASLHGEVGHKQRALDAVDEGLAHVEKHEERFYEVPLRCLRAELRMRLGHDAREVEADFREALSIARRQQAKLLELRTAVRWYRFMRSQGRAEQSALILKSTLDWFTEGLDTADVNDAKALLDAANKYSRVPSHRRS